MSEVSDRAGVAEATQSVKARTSQGIISANDCLECRKEYGGGVIADVDFVEDTPVFLTFRQLYCCTDAHAHIYNFWVAHAMSEVPDSL